MRSRVGLVNLTLFRLAAPTCDATLLDRGTFGEEAYCSPLPSPLAGGTAVETWLLAFRLGSARREGPVAGLDDGPATASHESNNNRTK